MNEPESPYTDFVDQFVEGELSVEEFIDKMKKSKKSAPKDSFMK